MTAPTPVIVNNTCKSNLVLIGMPGAGKSTVGVILAKLAGKNFIDTDLLIQIQQQATLQQIVDQQSYLRLREIETDILCQLDVENSVIATGGSAVYSDPGMQQLKMRGTIIYLQVSLEELHRRISNYDQRGIARRPEQSLDDLFSERTALYRGYADVTIDCNNLTPEEISAEILAPRN